MPPLYEWVYFYVASIANCHGSRGGRTSGLWSFTTPTKKQEHLAAQDALITSLAADFDTQEQHVQVELFLTLPDQLN